MNLTASLSSAIGPAARMNRFIICIGKTLGLPWCVGVLWFGLLIPMAHAELKLPAVIADHMVLQQQAPNPIWGWDDPGTKITVSFAGKTYRTLAGADGKWQVNLAPQPANASPQTLTVTGSTAHEVQDVLIGEVWLCSGQSNMEMGIGMVENGAAEITRANVPQHPSADGSQPLDATTASGSGGNFGRGGGLESLFSEDDC